MGVGGWGAVKKKRISRKDIRRCVHQAISSTFDLADRHTNRERERERGGGGVGERDRVTETDRQTGRKREGEGEG